MDLSVNYRIWNMKFIVVQLCFDDFCLIKLLKIKDHGCRKIIQPNLT